MPNLHDVLDYLILGVFDIFGAQFSVVCKIPLLLDALGQARRATIGYLVYKVFGRPRKDMLNTVVLSLQACFT